MDVVLLGAGASVEAGVPSALSMTKEIISLFKEQEDLPLRRALLLLLGGLQMRNATLKADVGVGVDVERLINGATLLANRFDTELAPFVGTWHPLVDEIERLAKDPANPGEVADEIGRAIMSSIDNRGRATYSSYNIRRALEESFEKTSSQVDGYLYKTLVDSITNKLLQLTWIENSERVSYFEKLVRAGNNKRITIATLNYDNSIELAARSFGIPCESGIEYWINNGSLPDVNVGVEILKLHGSVDWRWVGQEWDDENRLRSRKIEKLSHEEMMANIGSFRSSRGYRRQSNLGVIFGKENKLTAEGPFLDLFMRFRQRLAGARNLYVIGYSFRDLHVNMAIVDWIAEKGSEKHITIIEAPNFDQYEHPFWKHYGWHERDRCSFLTCGAKEGIGSSFP